ncbi:MFS transporter [Salinarimonas soli]|uniref:MFS transporter n=1 Tax=Salinarimonas soli TaxID=1638099 RepID=A0A5B2VU28_9HYPH|nr:MFS transporter [Salinarimonas soli]KAA2242108.1 MFS transporter [Salinarimonas soli]
MHQPARRISPEIILFSGLLIALLTSGPRVSMGLFQLPVTAETGWGRDVFSLAIALQNLLWGLGQPFAGAVADRFGAVRVLITGALFYAVGLVVMAQAPNQGVFHLGAGIIIGLGLSGCSFNLVLGAFGKLLPESWRPMAFGAGTAAGSFGQFLFPPFGTLLIGQIGWHQTLLVFSVTVLLVLPLAMYLASPPAGTSGPAGPQQSIGQALSEAFRHPSYVLLVAGFFTCGFQVAFITAHLPAYLRDIGMPAWVGGWSLALIGLANAVGSLSAGYLSGRMPKRWILAFIYAGRSAATVAFLLLPPSPATALVFSGVMGFLWLSTVPPTSGLVMQMFGTRYMAMLFGFAFLSHQVGSFAGVWLGGVLYERSGSYDVVWWLSVALGIASAVIALPIKERPVVRAAVQPAE